MNVDMYDELGITGLGCMELDCMGTGWDRTGLDWVRSKMYRVRHHKILSYLSIYLLYVNLPHCFEKEKGKGKGMKHEYRTPCVCGIKKRTKNILTLSADAPVFP